MEKQNSFWARIPLFLAAMGPGIVTAFADNDAGGIATYAAAGAKYGYALLFTMFISTVCLVIAQEMSARTGAVTGKGLSATAVERAIAMSHDKYCSASIMLAKTARITTSFDLVEVD